MNAVMTTTHTAEEITPRIVAQYIRRHQSELERLTRLYNYYIGDQAILERAKSDKLSNNRLVCNYCQYISDIASAYLLGAPVSYTADHDILPIIDILNAADAQTQDVDLALDSSIFGRCYEMVYMSSDEKPVPKFARVSPLNSFVVYDDTVEQKPVFGVHYYPIFDDFGTLIGYKGVYSTAAFITDIELTTGLEVKTSGEPIEHYFGSVTIDEIYNNGQRRGDFESVMSLNDAYNILQSDRVNDKEQFVEALLVIKGQVLGDTDEESYDTYKALKEHGVMTLDAGSDAAYLTRQFDENSVEVLKTSIENDIHKFSCVPDMSDENFAGNVSGVAMRYKLFALEQKTRIKERYFAEGMRYRLAWIQKYLETTGKGSIPIDDISINFTRPLPTNIMEEAQAAAQLDGLVSKETLLGTLSIVKDPAAEVEALEKEQEEKSEKMLKNQQALIRTDMRTPIINGNGNG